MPPSQPNLTESYESLKKKCGACEEGLHPETLIWLTKDAAWLLAPRMVLPDNQIMQPG